MWKKVRRPLSPHESCCEAEPTQSSSFEKLKGEGRLQHLECLHEKNTLVRAGHLQGKIQIQLTFEPLYTYLVSITHG